MKRTEKLLKENTNFDSQLQILRDRIVSLSDIEYMSLGIEKR